MKKVTFKQIVDHFTNKTNLAAALGISRQAVYLWDGMIPEVQARRLVDMDDFPWQFEQLPVKKFHSGSGRKARKCA